MLNKDQQHRLDVASFVVGNAIKQNTRSQI